MNTVHLSCFSFLEKPMSAPALSVPTLTWALSAERWLPSGRWLIPERVPASLQLLLLSGLQSLQVRSEGKYWLDWCQPASFGPHARCSGVGCGSVGSVWMQHQWGKPRCRAQSVFLQSWCTNTLRQGVILKLGLV